MRNGLFFFVVCLSAGPKVLQKKWIELDQRMGVVSFSRPDKREAIEDELLAIERRLQSLTGTGAV